MNIPIDQYMSSGVGLIATIVSLIGMWFKFQNKVERLEEDKEENKRQISAFWKWKDDHEQLTITLREKFNKELGEIRASLLVTNEQFKQIMQALLEIKERLTELENKNGRN